RLDTLLIFVIVHFRVLFLHSSVHIKNKDLTAYWAVKGTFPSQDFRLIFIYILTQIIINFYFSIYIGMRYRADAPLSKNLPSYPIMFSYVTGKHNGKIKQKRTKCLKNRKCV
ncbi:MAG: hypothetical protein AAB089_05015, partial [Nitrospirota bacterium]